MSDEGDRSYVDQGLAAAERFRVEVPPGIAAQAQGKYENEGKSQLPGR